MDIMVPDGMIISNRENYYGNDNFFESDDDREIDKIIPLTITPRSEDDYMIMYLCKNKSGRLFTLSYIVKLDDDEKKFVKEVLTFYDGPETAKERATNQFANTMLMDTLPGFLTTFIITSDDINSGVFNTEVFVKDDKVKVSFGASILSSIKCIEETIISHTSDADVLSSAYTGYRVMDLSVFKVDELCELEGIAESDDNDNSVVACIKVSHNDEILYLTCNLAINYEDAFTTSQELLYNKIDDDHYIVSTFYQTDINDTTYVIAIATNNTDFKTFIIEADSFADFTMNL